MHRLVLAHEHHGLGIASLFGFKVALQMAELGVECVDGAPQGDDVLIQAVDGQLLTPNLMVEHQHAVQARLHVLAQLRQLGLRLLACPLGGSFFVAQLRFFVGWLLLLFLSGWLLCGCLLCGLLLGGGGRFLHSRRALSALSGKGGGDEDGECEGEESFHCGIMLLKSLLASVFVYFPDTCVWAFQLEALPLLERVRWSLMSFLAGIV